MFYFSFILEFVLKAKNRKKRKKITQHKNIFNSEKKEKEEGKRRKKKEKIKIKLIKIAIGILNTSYILSSIICHLCICIYILYKLFHIHNILS